jgi:hypothetical protein
MRPWQHAFRDRPNFHRGTVGTGIGVNSFESRPPLTNLSTDSHSHLQSEFGMNLSAIPCRPQKYRSRESSRERVFMMQPTKD